MYTYLGMTEVREGLEVISTQGRVGVVVGRQGGAILVRWEGGLVAEVDEDRVMPLKGVWSRGLLAARPV